MRIQGILLPSDWNDDGQVTALILATSDESELPIQTDKPPGDFEPYDRKRVIVDGDLARGQPGSIHLDRPTRS